MAKSLADLVELCIERQGAVTGVIPPEQGAKSISDEIAKWRAEWLLPRYEAMAAALRCELPGWEWAAPSGGLVG